MKMTTKSTSVSRSVSLDNERNNSLRFESLDITRDDLNLGVDKLISHPTPLFQRMQRAHTASQLTPEKPSLVSPGGTKYFDIPDDMKDRINAHVINQAKKYKKYFSRNSTTTDPDIFLGGSCNPTEWRFTSAIPLLEEADISYFNPQVEDWYEELIALEVEAKETCKIILMVIDGLTRSIVSINESVEYICRGRRVVLMVENIHPSTEIGGVLLSPTEIADLNGARDCLRNLARKRGVHVYAKVESAVEYAIQWLLEQRLERPKPELPRLRKRASIVLNKWSGTRRTLRQKLPWSSSSSLEVLSDGDDGSIDSSTRVKNLVYLGGNLRFTLWRETIAIPTLQKYGIPYAIPQLDYLSYHLRSLKNYAEDESQLEGVALEQFAHLWRRKSDKMKHDAEFILFVIPSAARSIASMTEAVEMVCDSRAMILVLEPLKEGDIVDGECRIVDREYKDLVRARAYLQEMAERRAVDVYHNVKDAIQSIVGKLV